LRLQGLFSPPDQFMASLTSAQQSFQINGEQAFNELDPAALAAALGTEVANTATPLTGPMAVPSPTSSSSAFTDAPRAHLTPLPATTPVIETTPTPAAGNVPVM